MILLLLRP